MQRQGPNGFGTIRNIIKSWQHGREVMESLFIRNIFIFLALFNTAVIVKQIIIGWAALVGLAAIVVGKFKEKHILSFKLSKLSNLGGLLILCWGQVKLPCGQFYDDFKDN